MTIKIIDLFAGCGGLLLGFVQNGHKVVKAVEFGWYSTEKRKNDNYRDFKEDR